MNGVVSYSVYIPRYVLPREAIAQAWSVKSMPGSKAVRNFDEDSLTMAHAAASRLPNAPPECLYFASTTSPYLQRSSASQIAAACGLPADVRTADFAGTLRAGTSALLAAVEGGRPAWVVASDTRDGAPESLEEMLFGDAAAAVAVGAENVIAEVVSAVSRSDDFLDEWRRDSDGFVHSFASKYSLSHGYEANILAAARECLRQAGIEAGRVSWAALPSPDGRAQTACAKALGIDAAKVIDSRIADIGLTGTAMPFLMLAQALDRAQPGDLILLAGYGEGADAILFRATSALSALDRPRLKSDSRPIHCSSYPVYRKLRDYMRSSTGGPEISNVFWKREERQNVRLQGTLCPKCGAVHYPPSKTCPSCRNRDGLTEKALARTGRLFTFTKDYLYDSPNPPAVMAVVDLDGGGRLLCQMTDVQERDVEIGMPLEMVLRRLRDSSQNHHYYWKCRFPC